MTDNYNGLEVFGYQFDRFAYEHPWIGDQVGEFMLGPEGGGMLEFANATVFALPRGGAHEVHGPILDWYLGHGGPYGALGYPISNERPTPTGSGRYHVFERGVVGWLPEVGAFAIGGLGVESDAASGAEVSPSATVGPGESSLGISA